MRNKDEEIISSMLLNDVMYLTVKSRETKKTLVFDLLETSYLKILKRIIASGREIGLDFQNISEVIKKENQEIFDFLQTFKNDPEKSLISLRNELGLSG